MSKKEYESYLKLSKDMAEEMHKMIKERAENKAKEREYQLMKELIQRIKEEEPYEWILW